MFVLVWLVNIVDSDDGKIAIITEVTKCNSSTWLYSQPVDFRLREIKRDRDGEEVAIH